MEEAQITQEHFATLMEDFKGLREDFLGYRSAVNEFLKADSERNEQMKQHGSALGQNTEKIEKIETDLSNFEGKWNEALAKFEAYKAAPLLEDGKTKEETEKNMAYKAAYGKFIREGKDAMKGEELNLLVSETKTLSEGIDTLGGFFVPADMSLEIIKGVTEMSPIRQIARVWPTGRDRQTFPKRTGQFAAVWVGEQETRAATDGLTFGQEEIPVGTLQAMVPLTFDLAEDSAISMDSVVNEEFAEQFALAEGIAFTTGDGEKGKPAGFAVDAQLQTNAVVSGSNSTLKADGLIDLFYDLKTPYQANATFVMERASVAVVRKLKDGDGQYLWTPGALSGASLAGAEPATILSRPLLQVDGMASIAQNAYPVACGDFRRGYYILDRRGMTVRRIEDSTTMAANTFQLWATRRVGGQVVNTEAIRLQKIST